MKTLVEKTRQIIPFVSALIVVQALLLCGAWADHETPMDVEGRAFFRAKGAFDDKFYPEARMQLADLLEKYPRSRFRTEAIFLLGRSDMALGQNDRAQFYFRKILKASENPFQEPALFFLAQTAYEAGKDSSVLRTVQDLVRRYPLSGHLPAALLSKAKALQRMGREKGARATLSKVMKLYPSTPAGAWAGVELAKLYQAQGQFEKVVPLLQQILSLPVQPLAPGLLEFWLAQTLRGLRRHEEAIPWYDKVAALPAGEFGRQRALLGKAKALAALGNGKASTQAYEDFLSRFPDSRWKGWALIGLAWQKLLLGDVEKSLKIQQEMDSSMVGPRLEEAAAFLKCETEFRRKNFGQAAEAYSGFLAQYASGAYRDRAAYRKGLALLYASRPGEADEVADIWLRQAANSPTNGKMAQQFLVLKGDAKSQLGHWGESAALYHRAWKEFPQGKDTQGVLQRLADCYHRQGRWAEAIVYLQDFCQAYPDSTTLQEMLYRLAWAQFRLGKWADAAQTYQDLAEKFPQGTYAEQAYYQMASARFRLGDYAKAQALYASLLEKFPKGIDREKALLELAWTFASEGKNKEALENFQTLIKQFGSGPFVPQALFWMGQESLSSGDFPGAQKYFARIAEKFPNADLADDALFCQGIALARAGRLQEALDVLQKLLAAYPSCELKPEVLFLMADVQSARKLYGNAIGLYAKFLSLNADPSRAAIARMRIADCTFARGDYKSAHKQYDALVASPQTAVKTQALFKKAIASEALGFWDQAKEDLMDLYYNEGEQAGWSGKAALKLGEIFQREDRPQEALVLYERLAGKNSEEAEIARRRAQDIRRVQSQQAGL